MNNFCGKCGSPVDPDTGACPACGNVNVQKNDQTMKKPADGTNGSVSQPGVEFKKSPAEKKMPPKNTNAKSKEEKKKEWNDAKKRYKEDTAQKKKDKKAAMSKKQKAGRIILKIVLIVLVLALLATGVYFGLKTLGVFSDDKNIDTEKTETEETTTELVTETVPEGSVDIYSPPTESMPDEYNVTSPNADEYFSNNAEIIAQSNASSGGSSEADVYAEFVSRGFKSFSITTRYKSDGTLIDEKEISKSGTEKHPTYQTYYTTADGDFWTIFEINGHVMANPVSYNMENGSDVQVIISETGTIMSYDSTLNKFYETKPQETALTVKVVDKINAETLENVDIDALLDIAELATETEVALTDAEEEVV